MRPRRLLIPYLVVVFCLSWASWLLLAWLVYMDVFDNGNPLFWVLLVLGGISPTVAAFSVLWVRDREGAFGEWLRQFIRFKVCPGWYLFVLAVPLLLTSLPWLAAAIGGTQADPIFTQSPIQILVLVPIMILGGGLEEPGWQGLMLPELLKGMGPSVAVVVVGLV